MTTDIQNEIRYSMAFGMLTAMMRRGTLTKEEFDAIHRKIIRKYRPAAVRRLAWTCGPGCGSVAC